MTQQCSKKWSARAPPLHCPPEAHSTLRGPRIRHWFRPAHSVAFGARDHSQYIGTVFYLFTTKPPYFSLTGPWRAGDDSEADELSASARTVAATELLPSHIVPQFSLTIITEPPPHTLLDSSPNWGVPTQLLIPLLRVGLGQLRLIGWQLTLKSCHRNWPSPIYESL